MDVTSVPIRLGCAGKATISGPTEIMVKVQSMLSDLIRDDDEVGHIIVIADHDGKLAVSANGRRWDPGSGWAKSVFDQLVYVMLRLGLDTETELLHLHAGYVSTDEKGVLIAGFPGSGKSTLVAHLVEAGFGYLTDEWVGVDESLKILPFAKPISVTQGSFEVLDHLNPVVTGAGLAGDSLWHVPASTFGLVPDPTPVCPTALVFVEFGPGADTEITEVHPIEAARLLLEDSPDIGRFGARALKMTVSLCASIRCHRLVFADSTEAVAAVKKLAHQTQIAPNVAVTKLSPPLRLASHDKSNQLAGGSVLWQAQSAQGVTADGRSLFCPSDTTELIELDEVHTTWLRLLNGISSIDDLVGEVATVNRFSKRDVADIAFRVFRTLQANGLVK